jgi:urea transport system substrate-binding protein
MKVLNSLLATILTLTFAAAFAADGPIKIGLLEDQTGILAQGGQPKIHAAELAVEEINSAGGVLGRKLQLTIYDGQSDNRRYQEFARRLTLDDKVDVLMGGLTSASRVAIQPIAERNKTLYFYNNEYEGGTCDSNMVLTGVVPEQYLALVPWMLKNVGKKVYIIAADYNFGQILGAWVRKLVAENGGTLVGEEYIPLSVSQFGQTISNIQAAKPDFVFTAMVGSNQVSYFQQASAAGLKLPMASPINGPLLYEHKQLPVPVMANMYLGVNYMEELKSPENKSFVERFRARFPNEPYINQPSEQTYVGVKLYAEAVRLAGTTDRLAVIKTIESKDVCTDSPEGRICMDRTTHHVSHRVHIMKVEADHSVTTVEDLGIVKPTWLHEMGCDLTKGGAARAFQPQGLTKGQ